METNLTQERLEKLGLMKVSKKVAITKKVSQAYEFYRYVKPEIFDQFNLQMKFKTLKILNACPKCYGKGKEELFYNDDPKVIEEMIVKAQTSELSADQCNYCQRTGAETQVYDKLRFTKLEDSDKLPPEPCLYQLEVAVNRGCFDYFEVADIETIQERPDPIIFGCIKGCKDKFFVTQWDTDVDINDILGVK
jgi:hypothetical protein